MCNRFQSEFIALLVVNWAINFDLERVALDFILIGPNMAYKLEGIYHWTLALDPDDESLLFQK
jgi:hypothetical protein